MILRTQFAPKTEERPAGRPDDPGAHLARSQAWADIGFGRQTGARTSGAFESRLTCARAASMGLANNKLDKRGPRPLAKLARVSATTLGRDLTIIFKRLRRAARTQN